LLGHVSNVLSGGEQKARIDVSRDFFQEIGRMMKEKGRVVKKESEEGG
jgi:hypothetical protein